MTCFSRGWQQQNLYGAGTIGQHQPRLKETLLPKLASPQYNPNSKKLIKLKLKHQWLTNLRLKNNLNGSELVLSIKVRLL